MSELIHKVSKRGGARQGAGRPKGSKDKVSVTSLLETLEQKAGGQSYEELLIEDFLNARLNDDRATVMKYHHMLLGKLVADKVEVDMRVTEDAIESKKQAFIEAMNSLSRKDTQ